MRRRTQRWLAALVAVGVAGLLLAQLFAGPDVGLADNGDGRRVMCPVGLDKPAGLPPNTSPFVVFDYRPAAPDPSCGWRSASRYATSQVVLVAAARGLDDLVTGGAGLDLRWLGGLTAGLLGLAAAILFRAAPGPDAARWLLVAGVTLVLVDVAFAAYLVSPYSEPTAMLGLVLAMAATLAYLRAPRPGWGRLLAVLGAFLVVVTAKSQFVPVAVLGAAVLLARPVATPARWRRLLGGRTLRDRAVPAVAAVLLVLAGAGMLRFQGVDYRAANIYNLVFYTVLADSSDPAGDLAAMGLPPDLARYAGTGAWSPPDRNAAADPAYPAFQERASRRLVLAFLAGHPDRVARMVGRALTETTVTRVPYLGNLAGPAGPVLVDRPAPVTWLLGAVRPAAPVLLPLLWLLGGLGGLAAAWRARRLASRAYGGAAAVLAATAASQVPVALLGDGYYELAKHLVVAAFATGLLLAVLAAWAVAGWRGPTAQTGRRRKTARGRWRSTDMTRRSAAGTQTVSRPLRTALTTASATACGVVARGAGGRPSVILLRTKPGRTTTTRTPLPASRSPRPV